MSVRPIVIITLSDEGPGCLTFRSREGMEGIELPANVLEVTLPDRVARFIGGFDQLIFAGGNDEKYAPALEHLLLAAWLKGFHHTGEAPTKTRLFEIKMADTGANVDAIMLDGAIRTLCDLDMSNRNVENLGPGYFQMWHVYRELLWTMWNSGNAVKTFATLAT